MSSKKEEWRPLYVVKGFDDICREAPKGHSSLKAAFDLSLKKEPDLRCLFLREEAVVGIRVDVCNELAKKLTRPQR